MTLLHDYIKHLKLDPEAKYPWQVLRDEQAMAAAKQEILRARKLRYGPHLELVRNERDFCDYDPTGSDVDPDFDGRVP